MDEITGILSAKIARIGTKSEGPDYYIKPLDDYANRWSEILVWKKTHLWENDPCLTLMLSMAKSYLVYNKFDDLKEIGNKIDRITAEEILEIANEVLDNAKLSSLTFI